MNEVGAFINKLKVNDLSEEMWKNVSNIKVCLVIGCFMEIIADYCKKTTNY